MRKLAAFSLAIPLAVLGVSCGRLFADDFPAPDATPPSVSHLAPWKAGSTLRETYESLPEGGDARTELRLLMENHTAWVERWRLVGTARETLDLSSFIVKDDIFGMSLLGYLLVLAERGVNVRLSLDGQGTRMTRDDEGLAILRELVATHHVQARTYRPVSDRITESLLALRPGLLVPTEHDKILVVDARRSIIGGRNIAEEYFDPRSVNPRAFQDADVRIDSRRVAQILTAAFETQYTSDRAEPVASEDPPPSAERRSRLRIAFEAMDAWLHGRDRDLRVLDELDDPDLAGQWRKRLLESAEIHGGLTKPAPPVIRAETRILDSAARFGVPHDPISEGLTRLFAATRDTVTIQSPYVVLPEQGVMPFVQACARGAQVNMLTNGPTTSDNSTSQALFLDSWPRLLRDAPCLHLWVANDTPVLHAKVASFDDQVGVIGTYNLEPMSMFTSSEVVAVVWSREFARALMKRTRSLTAGGPPQVVEYRIARDELGAPVLDDQGEPKIAFGPRDHVGAAQVEKLELYDGLLQLVDQLHLVPSIF